MSGLSIVSLVAGLGSVAFMSTPRFLVGFAFLVALAGLVCGIVALSRREGAVAVVGTVVSGLMTLVYGTVALA